MGDVGERISGEMAERVLERRGHGVLSLASGDDGYGTPVSYGYDPEHRHCVMHLVVDEGSRKQELLQTSETSTLTTYVFRDDGTWESVIAEGSLRELSDAEVADRGAAVFFNQAASTLPDTRQKDEFETAWYALEVDRITARGDGGAEELT